MLQALVRLAPAVAVLVLALKVRQALARFRTQGATSAVELKSVGLRRSPALRLLERRGVLVQTTSGAYYLDSGGYEP